MVSKKRVVVSYKNCPANVLQAIKEKYPMGYGDAIIKVQKPNGDVFHAITIDFDDISYLVKVVVKIDNLTAEEFEKQFSANANDEENISEKNIDPDSIASSSSDYD